MPNALWYTDILAVELDNRMHNCRRMLALMHDAIS